MPSRGAATQADLFVNLTIDVSNRLDTAAKKPRKSGALEKVVKLQ
jgi:hypothetical protein